MRKRFALESVWIVHMNTFASQKTLENDVKDPLSIENFQYINKDSFTMEQNNCLNYSYISNLIILDLLSCQLLLGILFDFALHQIYSIDHKQQIQMSISQVFQQRRIFVNSRKKPLSKNILPEIKFSPNLPKKLNDDLLFAHNNTKLVYNFEPLSNILVSKKIMPTNPEQAMILVTKKRAPQNHLLQNINIRKKSSKKITDQQQQDSNSQQKRNSTSLSQRKKQREFISEDFVYDELKINKISKPEELTFAVVNGNNNQDLVRSIMNDRKIWKQIKFGEGVPNFKWVFYKDKHNYKKMWSYTKKKIINHFEFNHQISTKDSLVRNLQIYCETKKIEVFTITPITFILDFDDQYCDYNMKQFLQFFQKNDPRKNNQKKSNFSFGFLSKFHPYMAWQNSDIKKKVNILSKPVNNATYYSENSYLWLLKPTGLNRGRGIEIFDSLQQLQKILSDYLLLMNRKKINQKLPEKQKGGQKEKDKDKHLDQSSKRSQKQKQMTTSVSKQLQRQQSESECTNLATGQAKFVSEKFKLNTCSFVIQKYVEKPFLIHDRKFDIRVWALLTQNMNIYFFKEGYIRTSAQAFSTQNIENYFIHLTNNAVQKYSSNYGQFQNANQLSFWNLKQYMPQTEVDRIWDKIKEITYMAFSSVKKKINANQRKHCFELFGLDFFIDAELKVWLIQVNENPCIQCSSPLLGELIPRMLNDAFKLTIDQIIDRKIPEEKVYPVKGYTDHENMWECLGQLMPNSEYSPKR